MKNQWNHTITICSSIIVSAIVAALLVCSAISSNEDLRRMRELTDSYKINVGIDTDEDIPKYEAWKQMAAKAIRMERDSF